MLLKVKNGLLYMQFPHLAGFPDLIHGIFTRRRGVSPEPYDSLNVSYGLGDDKRLVRRNRHLMTQALGTGEWVFAQQVHGTRVLTVGSDGPAKRPDDRDRDGRPPLIGDALVTARVDRLLTIQVADCQAVLLYDPVQRVVANVHAGWRGTVANVVGKTIDRMQVDYGCEPGHVVAGIGPSLGPCCAEFVNYPREIPPEFWHHRVGAKHFNFWDITREQLVRAGVRSANVWVSAICTRCNPTVFFSYRRNKVTGRFAAVIGLQSPDSGGRGFGDDLT